MEQEAEENPENPRRERGAEGVKAGSHGAADSLRQKDGLLTSVCDFI